MIRLDTGEKIELHKHSYFEDLEKKSKSSGNLRQYGFLLKVAYYMLHREGFEKE